MQILSCKIDEPFLIDSSEPIQFKKIRHVASFKSALSSWMLSEPRCHYWAFKVQFGGCGLHFPYRTFAKTLYFANQRQQRVSIIPSGLEFQLSKLTLVQVFVDRLVHVATDVVIGGYFGEAAPFSLCVAWHRRRRGWRWRSSVSTFWLHIRRLHLILMFCFVFFSFFPCRRFRSGTYVSLPSTNKKGLNNFE